MLGIKRLTENITAVEADLEQRLGRKPSSNCEVITFKQLWGTTALGLDRMGGNSFCEAYTIIAVVKEPISRDSYDYFGYVYFDGKFAYKYPCSLMIDDIKRLRMPRVTDAKERYEK